MENKTKRVTYNFQKEIIIEDLSVCHSCKHVGLNENEKYCPKCGFPQRGEQDEMRIFLVKQKQNRELLKEKKSAINKGRNILFILSGLFLLQGVLLYVVNKDIIMLIVSIVMTIIFISLGFWSKKKPLPAILTGFFIYLFLIILDGVAEPKTLYRGIIWKIIIISTFVYAFKGIRDASKLEDELSA
jgi:ribosomal protein L37E